MKLKPLSPEEGRIISKKHLHGGELDESEKELYNRAKQKNDRNLKELWNAERIDVYLACSMRTPEEYGRAVEIYERIETKGLNIAFAPFFTDYTSDEQSDLEARLLEKCRCVVYFMTNSGTWGSVNECTDARAQDRPVILYIEDETNYDIMFRVHPRRIMSSSSDKESYDRYTLESGDKVPENARRGFHVVKNIDGLINCLNNELSDSVVLYEKEENNGTNYKCKVCDSTIFRRGNTPDMSNSTKDKAKARDKDVQVKYPKKHIRQKLLISIRQDPNFVRDFYKRQGKYGQEQVQEWLEEVIGLGALDISIIELEKLLKGQEPQEPPKQQYSIDDILKGKTFYESDNNRSWLVALRQVLDYAGPEGIVATMPEFIAARTKVEKSHAFWRMWHAVHTEEDIGIDVKGLFYDRNEPVLVVVHGGGILTPERIEQAFNEGFINGSAKFRKDEFDNLLEGRLPDGSIIPLYWLEEIKAGIPYLPHQFGIVMPYKTAQATKSGPHQKNEFLENSLVIARAGGLENLEEYYEKAKDSDGNIGNHHPFSDRDASQPQGHVLYVSGGDIPHKGLVSYKFKRNTDCRFVGVRKNA